MNAPHPPITPVPEGPSRTDGARKPAFLKPLDDPHCLECGFLLKGAPPAGTCPECGSTYDESTSRELMRAPSAAWTIGFVSLPLLVGILALVAAVAFGSGLPGMGAVALIVGFIGVPVSVAWFGKRLYAVQSAIMRHTMPRVAATRGGVQTLGCAATFVSTLAIAIGVLATAIGIFVSFACLVLVR